MTESGNNGCTYPDGLKNPNNVSVTALFVLLSGSAMTTVGTSWTAITSDWINPETVHGFELQVRAYGRSLNSSGGTVSIRFDNVRGEGT